MIGTNVFNRIHLCNKYHSHTHAHYDPLGYAYQYTLDHRIANTLQTRKIQGKHDERECNERNNIYIYIYMNIVDKLTISRGKLLGFCLRK